MARSLMLAMALVSLGGWAAAGEGWKAYTNAEGLPGNEIQFLKQDDAGAIWVGTLQGLGVWRDGKFAVALKDCPAYDVLTQGQGQRWVGTGNGAVLINGEVRKGDLKGSLVAPLVAYDDKTVWAIAKDRGTEQNKLVAWSGGEWQPVDRFKAEKVVDLARTPSGTVWVTIDGDGAYAVDPKQGVASAVKHLKGSNVNPIAEDSKKRTWAGLLKGGVMAFDGKEWTRHLEKEKSAVFSIKEDAAGNIWVATNANGIWRYDGKKWTNDLAEEGAITMLATTSDGKVWISSQMTGGLRYWENGKWTVALAGPLPVRCLLETKDKKVWAGGVLDGVHVQP